MSRPLFAKSQMKRTNINWMSLGFAVLLMFGCAESKEIVDVKSPSSTETQVQTEDSAIRNSLTQAVVTNLLDRDSLNGWEVSNFGGEGECTVKDGVLTIETGYPLSGVSSTLEDLPNNHYEISLEARRTQGIDFFCGLTFPINDSHCTLIVGGWAGAVVGLSCVDGKDASSNETKSLMNFDDNRWYQIRVSVGDSIKAWIDDDQVVDLPTQGREFSLRGETLICKPLGICTFDTTAEFRNVTMKQLAKGNRGRSQSDNGEE